MSSYPSCYAVLVSNSSLLSLAFDSNDSLEIDMGLNYGFAYYIIFKLGVVYSASIYDYDYWSINPGEGDGDGSIFTFNSYYSLYSKPIK